MSNSKSRSENLTRIVENHFKNTMNRAQLTVGTLITNTGENVKIAMGK